MLSLSVGGATPKKKDPVGIILKLNALPSQSSNFINTQRGEGGRGREVTEKRVRR